MKKFFYRTLTEFQSAGLAKAKEKPPASVSSAGKQPLHEHSAWAFWFSLLLVVLCAWTVRAHYYGSGPSMNFCIAATWLAALWLFVQSFVKLAMTLAGPLPQAARARFHYDYNRLLVAPPFLYRAEAGPGYWFDRSLLVVPTLVMSVYLIVDGYIFTGLVLFLVSVLDSASERTAVNATLRRLEEMGQRDLMVVVGPQELEVGMCPLPGCCAANLETREALGVEVGDNVRITYETTGRYVVRPIQKVSRNVKGRHDIIYLFPLDFQELGVPEGLVTDLRLTVEKEGDQRREAPVTA